MILTVFLLLVSVIGLSAATIAWFAILRNNSASGFNFYVKAPDTMMISALASPSFTNAEDWQETLQKSEITSASRGNQPNAFPESMNTISSLFNESSNLFYYGSHTEAGELNGYIPFEQPEHYVKISLWFKSTNSGFAFLDGGSFIKSIIDMEPHTFIADSIRIGFVPVNYDENGAASGGVIPGEAWKYAVIWEPNSTKHLTYYYGGPGGTGKLATYAVKNGVPVADPIDTEALASATALQTTYDFTDSGTNVNGTDYYNLYGQSKNYVSNREIALFNLNQNTMQQFNIYIWVEGADPDAINSVAKSTFRTYLKFGQETGLFMGNTFIPIN